MLGVELQGARGFLLPHRQNMAHLPEGPSHSLDLRVFRQTDGSEYWHRLYSLPQIGVVMKGMTLGNDELLGYGLGIAAYFSAPVVVSNRFKWYLELGAGPGFVTKPFNLEDNYQNIAISSYGNAFIMLGQRFTYRMSERVHLAATTSFNHFSNAAFSLPNLGINYPMASIGVSYFPRYELEQKEPKHDSTKVSSFWLATASGGVKSPQNPFNAKYPVLSLGAERVFGLSRKSSISVGLDGFYNAALYANRRYEGDSISAFQNAQMGIHVGYGMHVDRMMFILHMGAYALDSYKKDGVLFHRVGWRYFLGEHLGINLSLKTHFFKADYFELGIAYRF